MNTDTGSTVVAILVVLAVMAFLALKIWAKARFWGNAPPPPDANKSREGREGTAVK